MSGRTEVKIPRVVSDLKPAPYNPRTISGEAATGLANSLDRFGDIAGLTWNRRTGYLVTGHQRLSLLPRDARIEGFKAATDDVGTVGYARVVLPDGKSFQLRVVDWDETTERAANITANNPAIAGEFTDDLDEQLRELSRQIPELFREVRLDALLEDVTEEELPPPTDEPIPVPQSPVSQPQTLYRLGPHLLFCGDATDPTSYKTVLGDQLPDVVFTDPPYRVGQDMEKGFYEGCDSPAMKELSVVAWDQDFDIERWLTVFDVYRPVNGTVYVCASHKTIPAVWKWFESSGASHHSYLVWCKPNPMPSLAKRHWTWATELIAYGTYGRHTFRFPKEGHALSWLVVPCNAANTYHPTQKPVELVFQILQCSAPTNGVVLDCFAGSGTTLLACERLGLQARLIEIDPGYCDVIRKRWGLYADANGLEIADGIRQ